MNTVLRRFFTQKDITFQMLKRELLGDIVQISLKYGAYSLSQSQAVKAELMRTLIDTSNHILLYTINSRSKQISDDYYNHSE